MASSGTKSDNLEKFKQGIPERRRVISELTDKSRPGLLAQLEKCKRDWAHDRKNFENIHNADLDIIARYKQYVDHLNNILNNIRGRQPKGGRRHRKRRRKSRKKRRKSKRRRRRRRRTRRRRK